MKKQLVLTIPFLFACLIVWAQSNLPGINYQAVARDAKGAALANHNINLKITLRAGDALGKPVYEETHRVITNDLGLFNLIVGRGRVEKGEFSNVPWSEYHIWMELAMDETGGDTYIPFVSSQLMAVPYAFYAGTAGSVAYEEYMMEKAHCSATGIPFWGNLGNYNVNDTCHFLGTTVPVSLIFKTDNVERMRIDPNGLLVIQENTRMEEDLSVGGTLTIEGGLNIADNLIVTPDLVTVKRQFIAKEDALIEGNLVIIGHGTMKTLTILGNDRSHLLNTTDGKQIPAFSVVVLDEKQHGKIRTSTTTYDRKVVGVISNTDPNAKHRPGIVHAQENTASGSPVAIDGTVEVMAVGPIVVGDYLTSSDVPGHAMAAKNRRKSYGAIIGKAMTPLAKGEKGKVEMWVERH